MSDTMKRETIIALRARKEGHEIASEIGHPHMEVPEFHREVLPADDVIQFVAPEAPPPKPYPWIIRNLSIVLLGIIIATTCVGFLAFITR